ncbi:MAG: 23S rRNA (pseudouridine(1915)-N(3))-methyltransferase RlmH [Dissulfurispiraceae bacterium]|jgi:23S rRNA (pseudouridine1915-N3)-methyltransferase|nr:23S rRNA (pseudouridine(1915)-N(3))-methyltransferase RlmH [Dissulfurispiraceae bacterium]
MKARILWIGKTKEKYLAEGINKYLRMLEPFIHVEIVEIKEEKDKRAARAMTEEAARILKKSSSYFLLDEQGRQMSSTEFAGFIRDRQHMDFVLGGPYGVAQEIKDRAAGLISVSRMTLTHEMARLVFAEQLYRAFTIIKGKGYHH